jgi:glycosyltransferase involved in cell wall biosynthesis
MRPREPERIATLSKYPPYVSGHAHQAYWLEQAFAEATGQPQHQITYCGPVPAAYRDPRIVVHEVHEHPQANAKVPDGHLSKAVAARMASLAVHDGVTAFLALYADPHAAIAVRAARAAALSGARPVVAVSLEGSDITSSMARHRRDGEAAVLLGDVLAADVVMAVSRRAAELVLAAADEVLPTAAVAALAARLVLRPPGLPPAAFDPAPATATARLRGDLAVPPSARIVSTYVRLVPEKGIGVVVDAAAEAARQGRTDLVFVLAGTGPLRAELAGAAAGLPTLRFLPDPDPATAHALRCASSVALLPSGRTQDWEETFCIAAIESAAVGVPVLSSDSPAFAESNPDPRCRLPASAEPQAWLARVDEVLAGHGCFAGQARRHAAGFTAAGSARLVLEAIAAARAERRAPMPV